MLKELHDQNNLHIYLTQSHNTSAMYMSRTKLNSFFIFHEFANWSHKNAAIFNASMLRNCSLVSLLRCMFSVWCLFNSFILRNGKEKCNNMECLHWALDQAWWAESQSISRIYMLYIRTSCCIFVWIYIKPLKVVA